MGSYQKILVIHNRKAGQEKTKQFRQILNILEASGADIDVKETLYAGHARKIAQEYKGGPYDKICAAGGDGTINEVLNGLQPWPLPFGIIPLGTSNVLAKELFRQETAETISETLLGEGRKDCWLGKVQDQYFSLMVSVGPDARAVDDVNLYLKKLIGKAAYALAFLKQILFYRPVTYDVMIDGRAYQAGAVIVSKGKYYGGKFICAPDADLAKKEFHVVLLKQKGRLAALGHALKMALSRIAQDKSVKIVVGKTIKIRSDSPAGFQLDGDTGGRLPITITLSDTPVAILCDETKRP